MDTTTTTTETAATPVTAKPTPKKRNIKTGAKAPAKVKPAPKVVVEKQAKAPKAPAVNPHLEAGVDTAAYAGLSGFLNASRKVKIMQRDARSTGTMTERMQKSLYAMRRAYGSKHFIAKGWDNGVLRDLAAANLISLSGGITETIDGKPYMVDGDRPVQVMVTKAGQEYGKAA